MACLFPSRPKLPRLVEHGGGTDLVCRSRRDRSIIRLLHATDLVIGVAPGWGDDDLPASVPEALEHLAAVQARACRPRWQQLLPGGAVRELGLVHVQLRLWDDGLSLLLGRAEHRGPAGRFRLAVALFAATAAASAGLRLDLAACFAQPAPGRRKR